MGYIVTVKYIAEVTGAPHGAQIQKIYFPVPGAAPATLPATRYTSSALALTVIERVLLDQLRSYYLSCHHFLIE